MSISRFREELETLINRECMENGSNTPDFILARYLMDCLLTFEVAVNSRDKYYGKEGVSTTGAPIFEGDVSGVGSEDISATS